MAVAFPAEREAKRKFMFGAIESVRDVLELGAEEAEELRTLPLATVEALEKAGLFLWKLPEVLGGAEADPAIQFEVIEAVTRIDTSAGWCMMIGATGVGWPAAFLPDESIEVVFGGGRVPRAAGVGLPNGTATPRDGGYVLEGRWPFASGVRHSEWVWLGTRVLNGQDGPPEIRVAIVPTAKVTLHDNWHVAGLKGTGSCDVSLQDLFVPEAFTWDLLKDMPKRGGPVYRMGLPGFVTVEHAAFAIGAGRRALDDIIRTAQTKMRGLMPSLLAGRASFQRAIGECDLRLRAARALAIDLHNKGFELASRGETPGPEFQAQMRGVAAYATAVAADIACQSFRYGGGSALYLSNSLQRCLRDINAAAQHFMVSDSSYENHGQFLLGLPDANPLG